MTIDILGVPVSQLNYTQILTRLTRAITYREKIYVCVSAVHLIMECQKNKVLMNGVKHADIITPDGMPLVWISKMYGNQNATRVYGPNLTLMLCKLSQEKEHSVFLLGGAKGQSQLLKNELETMFSGIHIVGTADTPIRPVPRLENKKIVAQINSLKPDIVFVGIGCPNQELWMIENRRNISAPILVGVGAAFDFITGKVKQAPKWIQNLGFEWLFRLFQEPKRLWRRYCILNTLFIVKISKQLINDCIKSFYE